jgi:flagellar hook protein FlgE
MSISSAMLAGVTGLKANASSLAAISDNIANSNTVGYKRSAIDFADMVNSVSSSTYDAGGVLTDTRHYIDQQGTLQATSNVTDLAVSGDGFFVTSSKAAGLTAGDPRYYTRAGSFAVDANGYLKNSAGYYLQGWTADAGGTITTDSNNLSSLSPVNVLSVNNTAQPTTAASVSANLDSDQTVNPAVYSVGQMAQYNADPTTGIKPDFSVTVPVSDSKGGQRSVQIDFLKSGTANQWNAEIVANPQGDVDTGGATPGLIASGVVAFNPDGSLDLANTTLGGLSTSTANPPIASLSILASAAAPPAPPAVAWASGLGVAAQTFTLDLSKMTQFSAASSVSQIASNGTASGGISGISIDSSGNVTAVYGNGTTRTIARVAVATFPDEDGLTPVSGDAYQESLASGIHTFKTAGSAGAGTITPSSLEASTVDLSAEFTGLIATQEAYSASSKIITTADQMMQQLLNIKQ